MSINPSSLPAIDLQLLPTFPAHVQGSGPITVSKSGLTYTFGADFRQIIHTTELTPVADYHALLQNVETGSFHRASLADIYANFDPPNGSIGNDKLADMPEATVKGRPAGSGTGAPQDITVSQALDSIGDDVGTLAVRGPVGWEALAPGDQWKVLTSMGADAVPQWADNIPANSTVTDAKVYTPASADDPDAVKATKIAFLPGGTDAWRRDVQEKLRERRSVLDFIPFGLHADILAGTSTADVSAYMKRWLEASAAEGFAAEGAPGLYNIDAPIVLTADPTFPLYEVFAPRGMRIKSTSNVDAPLIKVTAGTSHLYSLVWRGGTIDNSLGVYSFAAQSNTCIDLVRLHNCLIDGVSFIGGANIDTNTGDSDACLTAVDVKRLTVVNCFMEGQADACIYTGGNNNAGSDADDGGEHIIGFNHFRRSWQAVTVKRAGPRTILIGNSITDCRAGFTTLETDGVSPGRQLLIQGNMFKRIWTRAIRVRQHPSTKIIGNHIEDWGYDADGVLHPPAHAIAIEGATDVDISHNTIKLVDYAKQTSHRGVSIDNATINGEPYTAGRIKVADNDFDNVQVAIEEASGVGANEFVNNRFGSGVNTRHTVTNADTFVEYLNPNTLQKIFEYGGAVAARVRKGAVSSPLLRNENTSVGISAVFRLQPTLDFGTVTAGNRVTLTVPAPGVTVGDFGFVNPPSGAHMPNGVVFAVRCKPNEIDVECRNYSNSTASLAAAEFAVGAVRFSA